MPSHKVVLIDYDDDLFDITPPVLAYMHDVIHAADGRLVIGQYHDEHAVIEAASDADLVIIQTIRPLLPGSVLQKLVKCRGLIRAGLGYDSIDLEAATKLGIPLKNTRRGCRLRRATFDERAKFQVLCRGRGATREFIVISLDTPPIQDLEKEIL